MPRLTKNHKKNSNKPIKVNKKNRIPQKLIKGVISIHFKKGFGFVQPLDPKEFAYDIFIPQALLKGALDGDTVEVKVVSDHKASDPGKWKGSINKVIKRGKEFLSGVIIIVNEQHAIAVVQTISPDKFFIINHDAPLNVGDRILVTTPPWQEKAPKTHTLTVHKVIGNISDPKTDYPAIIAEFQLPEKFSEECENESRQFSDVHITQELKHRKDLRNLLCYTIDSSSAKDFDDAVSLSRLDNGTYYLGVHIADVSFYVKHNSALDAESLRRSNSVYFPNRVIPMLPFSLSDNLCSLQPKKNRLALSIFMTIDSKGSVIDYSIHRSVIKSNYRMTYDEVNAIIESKREHPIGDNILLMHELSKKLQKAREHRGCIKFSLPSPKIKLNKNDEPISVFQTTQTESHKLIEEFMLMANETIAKHLNNLDLVLPYRIHEEPESTSLQNFLELVTSLGIEIKMTPTQEPNYQLLLEETEHHELSYFIHSGFIRSMKMAIYSTKNLGHYGLRLSHYTHFTSPIRRYIDLIIHRLLFEPENVSEESLEFIVKQCSNQERIAAKAELSFEKIKRLRLLSSNMNDKVVYKAIITATKQDGLSFIIPDWFHEDYIPISSLPPSLAKKIQASFNNKTVKQLVGGYINVQPTSVNLMTMKATWIVKLKD